MIQTQQLADIKSMDKAELTEFVCGLGMPKFRASQIFSWLHKGVSSFDEMTNLSKKDRKQLLQKSYISDAVIEKKQVSEYDGTVKYLFRLHDGEYVESVLMRYSYGISVCISTQVGCRMGCAFCATGLGGLSRNLAPSEMLAQIMSAQKDVGERVNHIVLMGMGEPLDNFDNVLKFLRLVTDPDGLCISMRHISVSTCGLVEKIDRLADMDMQFTLSISLHAPNDEIRSKIMPVNKRWNTEQLLTACRNYADKTHRRISFEYSLISGVNDSDDCARELASRLRGMLCHVNLIPINKVEENGFVRSDTKQINSFKSILESKNIQTTVRRTLGSDIDASCGQLRRRKQREQE